MEKQPTNPVKAIRKHCLDCVGNSDHEVKICTAEGDCFLWPFRFGTNPFRKPRSQEVREASRARANRFLHGRGDATDAPESTVATE